MKIWRWKLEEAALVIAVTGILAFCLAYYRFHTAFISALLIGWAVFLAIVFAITFARKSRRPHQAKARIKR